jgi:Protein of unknown function (DUF3180)
VTPVRFRGILLAALIVGIGGWALLDARQSAGGSPLPLPWTAPAGVLIVAGVVLVAGLEVRRWVTGRRSQPLDPLAAARIAVLAKAGAYTGGGLLGWYLAQAFVLLPDLVGDRATRFVLGLASALSAACLATAGLLAQRWCRRPPRDEDASDLDAG